MDTYRGFAQQLQRTLSIPFDASLSTISVALKGVAHHLSPDEATLLKRFLPAELRQLIVQSRPRGKGAFDSRAARLVVDVTAELLDVAPLESKRRLLAVIAALRGGIGPWEDVRYVELLDAVAFELKQVLVQAAVA